MKMRLLYFVTCESKLQCSVYPIKLFLGHDVVTSSR